MKYVLDMHTHTLASGHAYNTIREMTASAAKKGLSLLGITEHAPNMPGTCHEFYFQNYRIIDRTAYELPVMMGVELNILDEFGSVDMEPELLEQMDYCIASIHPPCIGELTKEQATSAILSVMENKYVTIIGHPDDSRFPLDYEKIVKKAKETKTLLEVNNSSLMPTSYRPGATENYRTMLKLCKEYHTPIILNSDAHVDTAIGKHDMSLALLNEISFPEELVVNTSVDKFKSFLRK